MKKAYSTIDALIQRNLDTTENAATEALIGKLKEIGKRGYFTKDEFLLIGMWKSPRPKQQYLKNTEKQ